MIYKNAYEVILETMEENNLTYDEALGYLRDEMLKEQEFEERLTLKP